MIDIGAALFGAPARAYAEPAMREQMLAVAVPMDHERTDLLEAGDYNKTVAEQCKRSLARFTREAWKAMRPSTPLEWSHHHDALCDHLQWLLEAWMRKQLEPGYTQPAKQMAINLPPTSLKTEIVMEFAPAWMWVRWPSWRVLCLSCNPRVALQSAVNSRRLIESKWYQTMFEPKWSLLDDQNVKSNYGNTAGGQRQSHGWTATVVGEHADAVWIDDPTDPKKVTRAELQRVNEDWPSIRNRVNDERSALRVVVQQRLDVDDFTGMVTGGRGGKHWVRVVFPLEYVADRRCTTAMPVDKVNRYTSDPDRIVATWSDQRTVEGEVLQPSRLPPDVVEELRLNAGPYTWASQYQQDPRPRDGGRVKAAWLRFCRLANFDSGSCARPLGFEAPVCPEAVVIPPKAYGKYNGWDLDWIWLSVDPANKKTERGSLYGMLAIGAKGAKRFVLDDRSRRGEWDEILAVIRSMVRDWRPAKLLIEGTATGPTLLRALHDELSTGKIRDAANINVICAIQELTPKEVGGDKEARLDGVINQISAGFLYVLEGAPWTQAFLEELTLFPNSPTKDRVDALTQLLAIARVSLSSAWVDLFTNKPPEPAPADPSAPAAPPGVEVPRTCRHEFLDGVCRFSTCRFDPSKVSTERPLPC